MTYSILVRQIRIIHEQFLKGTVNKRELARTLKISRTTVKNHLSRLKLFIAQFPNEISNVNCYITFIQPNKKSPERYSSLNTIFQSVFDSIANSNSNRRIEWRKYKSKFPCGYCYTQFTFYFLRWLNDSPYVPGH
jgi:hypothetical protein